jgi:hypothetical protein
MSELDNVRVCRGGEGAEPAHEGGGKACEGDQKALPCKESGHFDGEAEDGDQKALPCKEGGHGEAEDGDQKALPCKEGGHGEAEDGDQKALPCKEGGHGDGEPEDGDQKAQPVQEVVIRMPAIDFLDIPDSDDDSEGEFWEYCHESSGEDVKVRGEETPDFDSEDDDYGY